MTLFVTGTDTDIGKTFVTAGLVRALRASGRDAVALKPVASGFVPGPDGLRNADIEALHAAGDGALNRAEINVYAFEPAIAPHRAAEIAAVEIQLGPIRQSYAVASKRHQDVLVEGVGGFAVPLSPGLMLADLVRALDLPVLLVVGLRLGCISHALLTAQAIAAAGLRLVGWISNELDPEMSEAAASIEAIASRIGAPLLGRIPQHADAEQFAPLAAALIEQLDAPFFAQPIAADREP